MSKAFLDVLDKYVKLPPNPVNVSHDEYIQGLANRAATIQSNRIPNMKSQRGPNGRNKDK